MEPKACECGAMPMFQVHHYADGWGCSTTCSHYSCSAGLNFVTGMPTPQAALDAAIAAWNRA
jgi:hypothetical protein